MEDNPVPLDVEVRQALLSQEDGLSPLTPTPQSEGFLPTLFIPQPLSDSVDDHSQSHECLPTQSPLQQHPLGLTHLQETPAGHPLLQHSLSGHTQSQETPANLVLPRQTVLGHTLLQAGSSKYDSEIFHPQDNDEGLLEHAHHQLASLGEPVVHRASQEQTVHIPVESGHTPEQQRLLPGAVDGAEDPCSSDCGGSGPSDDGGDAVHERSVSLEAECGEYVVLPSSLVQQQESSVTHNDHPITAAVNGQVKTAIEHHSSTAQMGGSPVTSLDSSSSPPIANVPVSISSRFETPPNHTSSSQTARTETPPIVIPPAVSVTVGPPSISLSAFITHKEDLPRPPVMRPNRIFKVCKIMYSCLY